MKLPELFEGYKLKWDNRSYENDTGRVFAGNYIGDAYRNHGKDMSQMTAADIQDFVDNVDGEEMKTDRFHYFMTALMNRHVNNNFYSKLHNDFISENGEIDLMAIKEKYVKEHPLNS